MSFFTRRGDDGTTGRLGKGRLSKADPRIETVGALDEASAALGVARASARDPRSAALVLEVQRDLYRLMSAVSASPESAPEFLFDSGRIAWLEQQIETLGRGLETPAEFIVPGDSPAEAAFAMARTVVRRAERRVVALSDLDPFLKEYLNRLSSLLFVLELIENRAAGKQSTPART